MGKPKNEPALPPLSRGQLEVMEVVWERGHASVGEIWRALSQHRSLARNTVQTTVTRLEEKGWLRQKARDEVEGGPTQYEATRPQAATVQGLAKRLLGSTFRGSVAGLVMSLLEGQRLSSDEADQLRKLIDQAESTHNRGRKPGGTP